MGVIFIGISGGYLEDIIYNRIFYTSLTPNGIPHYTIYNIVPVSVLVLSVIGLFKLLISKKNWIITPVTVGFIYWVSYSFLLQRFIIDYQRVVYTTSILLVILSGFGLGCLINFLKTKDVFKKNKILIYLQISILVAFIPFYFLYTSRDNWQKLTLLNLDTDEEIMPAAPANRYLHEGDLELFSNLEGKKFLSYPWKGTVIGVLTDNYPMELKPGTIGMNSGAYRFFVGADCSTKSALAHEYQLDYIYSSQFKCVDFTYIDKSSEGFMLYKFDGLTH
jgi:hypothetical protein